jgi:hypothetical protein
MNYRLWSAKREALLAEIAEAVAQAGSRRSHFQEGRKAI